MTDQEKNLLRISANLCRQRNNLLRRIDTEKKKMVAVPNAKELAKKEADEYLESPKAYMLYAKDLLKSCLYALIPFVLGILTLTFTDGFLMLVGTIASGVVFYVMMGKLCPITKKNAMNTCIEKFIGKYEKQVDEANEHNNRVRASIAPLKQDLLALEQKMRNPKECCLHSSYWYAGEKIYQLVELGRANTLADAINLFEQIRAEEERKMQAARAAEDQRWRELTKMMEEGTSKYDEQKRQHWRDFELAALEYEIASIKESLDED